MYFGNSVSAFWELDIKQGTICLLISLSICCEQLCIRGKTNLWSNLEVYLVYPCGFTPHIVLCYSQLLFFGVKVLPKTLQMKIISCWLFNLRTRTGQLLWRIDVNSAFHRENKGLKCQCFENEMDLCWYLFKSFKMYPLTYI